MRLKTVGVDFSHRKGEFCYRSVFDHYTLCCFATPFLYWRDGVLLEGKRWDLLLNSPGYTVYHGPLPDAKEGFTNDWFHIEGEDFGDLLRLYPIPLNEAFGVEQSYFLRKYASLIQREFQMKAVGSEKKIQCLITEMVIDIHRAVFRQKANVEEDGKISEIRQLILINPEKGWTLEKMAQLGGYSVSRFCERYKKAYGVSPMNDVIRQRILMAKQLLESGQASVSSVADACGFSGIYYFSKCFRKNVGCTPSEYIERAKNGIETFPSL